MKVSIIIPTLNEEKQIAPCLSKVRAHSALQDSELIVSDGGSVDRTLSEAERCGPDRILKAPRKGRAAQLNHGAGEADGDILYFLHADAFPPANYDRDIREAVKKGYAAGTFRFRFDPMRPFLLWINSFMTRFSWPFVQGGDRSLFIERSLFEEIGGYDEERWIMEDFEILERVRPRTSFRVIPRSIRISSRKYRTNGYFRVQYANWRAMRMFRSGTSSERILQEYRRLLNRW